MEKRPLSDPHTYNDKFLNALADAFRLQEHILNSTDIAIFSVSTDGIITSFNRAAEGLLGYNANDLIGKANAITFHESDEVLRRARTHSGSKPRNEPSFDHLAKMIAAKGGSYRDEWTLIRKDGSRFHAQLSLSTLRDDQNKIVGYIGIPVDISALKKSTEEARVNEQKFRILAENLPGAIYLCEKEPPYRMLFVNDYIEKITGYPAEEFLRGDIHIGQLYHPEDEIAVNQEVQRCLSERIRFQLQYRLRHKSGEYRWIEEVGVGVFEDSEVTMLEGFLSDITAQKVAEETLRKMVNENSVVFNNAVSLNVIAGFDGSFKRVSTSWSTFTGWTEEELTSTPYIKFVHSHDKAATLQAMQYLKEGHKLFTFENRFRCKDGSYRWFLWGCEPDLRSQIIYCSAVDITERKKSEEKLINSKKDLESIAMKLQEQNRQLDEFAHIISHNLRSPVGNIQALINLLDTNSTMEDYKVIFEKLKNVAKNLGETMNDLMDTLKVKTQTDVERVEIRFKEMLDKVVQSLEGELIVAEASVTFDFNKAPVINYSRAYMESIFQNLLSNAIKYRSQDRKPIVHFESDVVNNGIELRVTDNGQGIDLEKFGDKLFGLHRTFHSHDQARGVGLFLTKTQIESLGGNISAESEVGQGTTFIIRFGN